MIQRRCRPEGHALSWPQGANGRNGARPSKAFLTILLFAITAHAGTVQIAVAPRAGTDDPLLLDSLRYPYSVTRLSYLLSHFALQSETGWTELPDQYAWLDAATRRNTFTLHDVPAGNFHALRFIVGVTATNDPTTYPPDHPLNPNLNGLHWNWQGGYIFCAVEGRTQAGDGYSFHIARQPVSITVTGHFTTAALLTFDIPTLLTNVTLTGSTHSRDGDSVAETLRKNLARSFQLRETVTSEMPALKPVKPLYLPAKYTPYRFTIPARFPIPALPRDNPLLEERVALGRQLFHEPLLSRNNSISCATCHDEKHAFADPRRYSLGVDGQPGKFNALPLQNLAWKSRFFWDGRAPSLREQVKFPITDHLEMDENLDDVCAKLVGAASPPLTQIQPLADYPALFAAAFDTAEITQEKIALALENFMLTLTSFRSKVDRSELTPLEQRGFELFFTEYDPRTRQYGADCFHCHGGATFSDNQIHDNGVGKFMTPSLRNVAKTAPYMHDGRFVTLAEVVEHYTTRMPRTATLDPNLAKHPDGGVPLSTDDKKALVAFLEALTDLTDAKREAGKTAREDSSIR
ncbi:MAG: MbnP family protein [Verrucomicrobiota bacterium]